MTDPALRGHHLDRAEDVPSPNAALRAVNDPSVTRRDRAVNDPSGRRSANRPADGNAVPFLNRLIRINLDLGAWRGEGRSRPIRAMERKFVVSFAALLLLAPLTQADKPAALSPIRAVIVGGGPTLETNQAAIESNVRYVGRLLPSDAARTTLFADGNANGATVQVEDRAAPLSVGERLLDLAFYDPDTVNASNLRYRKPDIGASIDGPDTPDALTHLFSALAREAATAPPKPLLLYFTGHGSPGDRHYENNVYNMWGDKTFSERQLAQQIARLPEKVPVTLIMAQCHSGGFANLLFEGGWPDGKPIARDFAGFFASEADRPAAGCTAEADESDYRDFTSYFFAALTGRDRLGNKVTGADYNHDGRVGMDEAFCYTLANDRSIDTPVCASDIFLRRFAPLSPKALASVPFGSIRAWATPAQRCALDSLAKSLRRERGDNLLAAATRELNKELPAAVGPTRRERKRALNELRTDAQRSLLARWPDLRDPALPDFTLAKTQAVSYLKANAGSRKWKMLLMADDALIRSDAAEDAQDIADAHLMRFVALGESVIRAHHLREKADAATKARFERLVQAEARTPF